MKKLLVISLVTVFLSSTALAYGPGYNVQVFVNNYVAVARVQNFSYYPVVCAGQVFGLAQSGHYFNNYLNGAIVAPGTYLDVYVSSNNIYNPMIDARANIHCTFY